MGRALGSGFSVCQALGLQEVEVWVSGAGPSSASELVPNLQLAG